MGRESRVLSIDVDTIIAELGHGKFHAISFFFIAVAIFFNSITGAIFIFTARDTEYRCYIPECDVSETIFRPPWLINAIPYREEKPSKCEHYVKVNISESEANITDTCSGELFQNNSTQKCEKWIYGNGDTIIRAFNIPCQEWKRTLVGTINSIGQFVCLSFSGLISDSIGRRSVMIYATVLSGVIGVAQSYASDYWTFLFFEFLVNAVGSGAYSASFVLGIEIMVPEKRVYASTIMNLVCGVATISLGVAAWLVPNWRYLLRVTYLPSVIMVLSLWAFPESIRWLLVKGRRTEASNIIHRAAKMNNVTLSEKVSKYLEHIANENVFRGADQRSNSLVETKINKKLPLKSVLKSRPLLIRLGICACCWMTNAFVYYGLSLNAVSIMGNENNPYLNFILVSLVELPAQGIVVFMLDTAGRRLCLCSSLIGSALSCFAFILIPLEQSQVSLVAYLFGKLFITVSFNVVYIYTAELFPTSLRHSILACCSMLGRFGSMLAPQTPLLEVYYRGLPMILFGATAILSGVSILTFPETLHIKLPDTIEEAENIGAMKAKPRGFGRKQKQVEEEVNLNEITSDIS